jgi:hypothetical protein
MRRGRIRLRALVFGRAIYWRGERMGSSITQSSRRPSRSRPSITNSTKTLFSNVDERPLARATPNARTLQLELIETGLHHPKYDIHISPLLFRQHGMTI